MEHIFKEIIAVASMTKMTMTARAEKVIAAARTKEVTAAARTKKMSVVARASEVMTMLLYILWNIHPLDLFR